MVSRIENANLSRCNEMTITIFGKMVHDIDMRLDYDDRQGSMEWWERILLRREELGVSQEYCSEEAKKIDEHFTQSQWSDYETGKTKNPSIKKLSVVADVLHCSLDWLAGRKGADSPGLSYSELDPDAQRVLNDYITLREVASIAAINKEITKSTDPLSDQINRVLARLKQ